MTSSPPPPRRNPPNVPASNIVAKPQPAAQSSDPRLFELTQLSRRFHTPATPTTTTLRLTLKPSDPDFVYSIDALHLLLHVPESYRSAGAASAPPRIDVLNTEIPAGYRVNVERGFDALVEQRPTATLLDLLNALDHGLERILSGEKAATVKIVSNFSPTPTPLPPQPRQVQVRAPVAVQPPPPVSPERRAVAKARRVRETAQLESRLKLAEVFAKSEDGIEYTVPLEAKRRELLPVPLLQVRSVRLLVPLGYDVQPARIEVVGVPEDVRRRVEAGFAAYMKANPAVSLTAAVNILGARVHLWAKEEKTVEIRPSPKEVVEEEEKEEEEPDKVPVVKEEAAGDKSHIKVIPRPPEWSFPDAEGSDDDDDDDDDDYDFCAPEGEDEAGEVEQDKEAAAADDVPHPVQEHGTSLSCPGITTTGIELLEVLTLNVNIKCTRCKTEKEVMNLRGTQQGMLAKPQAFRCDKCSEILGIGFRKDFIHQNSHRLGFFDLTGCTVTEILPSAFTPQCICSTPLPPPGLRDVVRGQSVTANCRECHRKMGLYIPEYKLLRITQGDNLNLENLPLKKQKDKDRYVAGTELPYKGKCKHYRKSTRWFRFSCCSKVFPCDKCHDEAENHHSEHANRMICGMCSREQNYRPEDCRFCGNTFFAKKLSHYWEGGKGTRDKRLMNKNDPRKYKRIGSKPATAG